MGLGFNINIECPQHKPPSPRTCTEVTSLQKNKSKNREALERGLIYRRPVTELVNQGILLNPSICNALKVKELQRAKTADILKRKIERRPDKQALLSQRILKTNNPGASAFIEERCNALTKNLLCESLNIKLERRPGSLELVEKGVLQVDPGVATLVRGGSIPYPRVSPTSSAVFFTVPEDDPVKLFNSSPVPSPPDAFNIAPSALRSSGSKSRTPSRSLKGETVISRYGSLVFHNYLPSSAASSNSPSLRINCSIVGSTSHTPDRLPKHQAREVQQAEFLHLEDAAQVHKRLGQEICQMKGRPPQKIAQSAKPDSLIQSFVIAQNSEPPSPQCFVFSGPSQALQQTATSSSPLPQISQRSSTQLLTTNHVFEGGSEALVTLNKGNLSSESRTLQQQHKILAMTPTSSIQPTSSFESARTIASLEEIESVWLNLRRLQLNITEEASRIGLNIFSSDGFPTAFILAAAAKADPNHSTCNRLNQLSKEHTDLCSLARLLIADRLEFLDEMDSLLLQNDESTKQQTMRSLNGLNVTVDLQKKSVGSNLERSLLQSYLCRLGGSYCQRRARQISSLPRASFPSSLDNKDATDADSNTTLPRTTVWRNSTIFPVHAGVIFCQKQNCEPVSQKSKERFAEPTSTTEAWMNQFYSPVELRMTTVNPASTMSAGAVTLITPSSVASVAAPMMHITSSVPTNLHLVNASATGLLSPVMTGSFRSTPFTVVATTSGGTEGGASFLSSIGGSSRSSGLVLTTDGSSCSIPASSDSPMLLETHDGLMTMEFSPSDLDNISSPLLAGSRDLSDVQDFLSAFPFDEQCEGMMGCSTASAAAISTSAATSFDLGFPPWPQFFGQPDTELLSRDLMNMP